MRLRRRPSRDGCFSSIVPTGQSLFPIEERKFPQSTVPGEVTSPTQPVPLMPEPFTRQVVDRIYADQSNPGGARGGGPAVSHLRRRDAIRSRRAGQGDHRSFPGVGGGAEWGGSAVDPNTGMIYINANQVAFTTTLVKNDPSAGIGLGPIKASVRSAMVLTVPALRRPTLRWWMCSASLRRRKLPGSFIRAEEECPLSRPSRREAGCAARVSAHWKRHLESPMRCSERRRTAGLLRSAAVDTGRCRGNDAV